jgi:WD40 repeat protein
MRALLCITCHDTDFTRSPDGTCLLASSADNYLRTFILPTDLLESRDDPHDLQAYSSQRSPEPVFAFTTHPYFNLASPETTLVLTSPRSLPIRLSSPFHPKSTLSSFPLICPTTEAYLTPSSLLFTSSGTHFLTGTDSLIALFDLSRNGSGPVTRLPTIPSKRHKLKGGGIGMRGIVSALAMSPPDGSTASRVLAAGTWTRWVGLYDAEGCGGTVANWTVEGTGDGAGVSQVHFSPCGRFLCITERKSDKVLVYDIRVTGQLLASLTGRHADTNQRLSADICPSGASEEGGFEVWAGGTDGIVRVWEGVGMREGPQDPTWEWMGHQGKLGFFRLFTNTNIVNRSSNINMCPP